MGDLTEAYTSAGTVSAQGTTKRTGDYALRTNPTTTAIGYATIGKQDTDGRSSVYDLATVKHKFMFRYSTKPAADMELFYVATNVGITLKLGLALNSTGNIVAIDSTFTPLGSPGASVLAANTWYRIEVSVGTGSNAAYELKIDGTVELSGTGDLLTDNNGAIVLGKLVNLNGESVDFFYDDVVIDDAAYPGETAVQRMDPDGNGTYTAWTGGFGDVDETPHDGDTTYVASNANNAESVTLESGLSAGISGTVKSVKSIAMGSRQVGALGNTYTCRLRSASTDDDTLPAPLAPSYSLVGKVYVLDPATAVAWVLSALDSIEVGVVNDAGGTEHRCTKLCAMIEYEDETLQPPRRGQFTLLGVGR